MFKVKVESVKQLEIVLSSKSVAEIILSRDSFAESDLPKLVDKIKKAGKFPWILLERISRYEEPMKPVGANSNSVGANTNAVGANFRSPHCRGELCDPVDLRTSTDEIFKIKNLHGIIIQNLDSFAYALRKINKASNEKLMIELNYTMNCYNIETKNVYENLYFEKRKNANEVPLLFTAPVELNIYELSDVGYNTMILYSYIDTMVSANCLRKNIAGANANVVGVNANAVGANFRSPHCRGEQCEPVCKYKFNFNKVQDFSSHIIDRKGKQLHYKTYCKYCYNKIFNTEPLFLLDKIDEIEKHLEANANAVGANANAVGANFRSPHCRGEQCELTPVGATHRERPSVYEASLTSGVRQSALGVPALTYRIDFSFENEKQVKDILSTKCPESFTRGHYKTSIK